MTMGSDDHCDAAASISRMMMTTSTNESSSYTDILFRLLVYVLAIPTAIWLVTYLLPQLYMVVRPVPDLKKQYPNVEWALVTGGGSGIGKALVHKLASQGLNVVIISLDDQYLKETVTEIKKLYPSQEFRVVGIEFAPGIKYMTIIEKEIDDIQDKIRIIFCNAGYMITGFLDQTPIEKLLANIECNSISAITISHYFIQRMVKNKCTGCIVFTSSVAGFIPTPFAAMYASTKAFISQYAACVHIECKPLGIDICSIHPSPVSSNFYKNLEHKVTMIEAAAKNAVQPTDITNDILRSIGCCAYRDLGSLAWATRMGTFFLPYNFFTELFATAAPFLPDWKTHNKNR